jgi:hypothetical protein
MQISMSTAQSVMKMDKNKTHLNTYTLNSGDANRVADIASNFLLKLIRKPIWHGTGYYPHWHTHDSIPSSRSFYGSPSW